MTQTKPNGWPRQQPLAIIDHNIPLETDSGLGPALICPRCGSNFLHSGRATTFDRREDGNITIITIVDHGLSTSQFLPSAQAENPSSRRHAITIEFDCEGCGGCGLVELCFSQHKGQTFVTWRYNPLIYTTNNS